MILKRFQLFNENWVWKIIRTEKKLQKEKKNNSAWDACAAILFLRLHQLFQAPMFRCKETTATQQKQQKSEDSPLIEAHAPNQSNEKKQEGSIPFLV